ncbi:MAG: transcription antitermination factor NusB [Bacteroidota bacterium]
MRRRIVREKVLQALYAHEVSGDPADHVIKHHVTGFEENKVAYEFAKHLVNETIKHRDTIDKIIKEKVANWDFNRIALLDRLVLRMAICELMYFDDIPPKVTMNEAIELAKLFSTEKSGHFVNGVLDAVLGDLKSDGGLHKSGRGLYDGEEPTEPVPPVKQKSKP